MNIQQQNWTEQQGWQVFSNPSFTNQNNLVFVFGARHQLSNAERYHELAAKYPTSDIVLCSTSGEIIGTNVQDDSVVATAVHFDKTAYTINKVNYETINDSYQVGKQLADGFDKEGLRHVFVLSDGQMVNGSKLVNGLDENLPDHVTLTGGLAGDAARFQKTLVGLNEPPQSGNIVAIGFYGESLRLGYGSVGGWNPFGPERVITKSEGNVLYELDGKSALELYKKYLGDKAEELPGSALLFPLSIKESKGDKPLVRTILSVDETNQSMTFAGNIPEGATARLMKANFDKLIDGASDAALSSKNTLNGTSPQFALLISCVGRKLVLDQRVEEEVESIAEIVGENTALTGFYSYGEIAPFSGLLNCELHNQTMTVTLLGEN